MKPYEFPTESATVIAGTGAKFNDRSWSACSVIGFQFSAAKTLFCLLTYFVFLFITSSSQYRLIMYVLLVLRDQPTVFEGILEGIQNSCADEDNLIRKLKETSVNIPLIHKCCVYPHRIQVRLLASRKKEF